MTQPSKTVLHRCEIVALFLGAPLLFSSNIVIARWMEGVLPPITMAFGRWLVAALLLTPFVWSGLRLIRLASVVQLVLPAILGGALAVAPLYAAASYTAVGNVALVMAATPLLVALIERVVWAVPLRRTTMAGVVLAAAGIAVTTFEGTLSRIAHLMLNYGDLLALAASIAWAGYTALLRHRRVDLPPMVFLWGIGLGGALTLLPFTVAEWELAGVPVFGATALGGVVALAVIAGIGAYLSYNRVVGLVGPSTASMAMYLVPVYGLALGAVVLHEKLQPYHAVAVALVLGGVAVATVDWGRLLRRNPAMAAPSHYAAAQARRQTRRPGRLRKPEIRLNGERKFKEHR